MRAISKKGMGACTASWAFYGAAMGWMISALALAVTENAFIVITLGFALLLLGAFFDHPMGGREWERQFTSNPDAPST